jgi:hypothetical protein
MPRGGYRPGGGRPRGELNLLTREINERMLAKGLNKAEATLDVMRFYYALNGNVTVWHTASISRDRFDFCCWG